MKRPFTLQAHYLINERMIPQKPNAAEDHLRGLDALNFQTKLRFLFTTNSFSSNATNKRSRESTRIKLVDDLYRDLMMIEDFEELQASDLLDYFNLQQEELFAKAQEEKARAFGETMTAAQKASSDAEKEAALRRRASINTNSISSSNPGNSKGGSAANKQAKDQAKEYAMASWMAFELHANVDDAHAIVVREALRNWFECVPFGTRQRIYREVVCEICTPVVDFKNNRSKRASAGKSSTADFFAMLNASSRAAAGDPSSSPGKGATLRRAKKVILVALLHEEDAFLDVEKLLLECDLYVSRGIQRLSVDVSIAQTMDDIFQRSLEYFNFQEKLFGPLEEELGDQGANPLRFAKELRGKKKVMQDLRTRADRMPREELMRHLRDHGCSDRGTQAELVQRLIRLVDEKLQLLGHGELSTFGKNNIARIFAEVQKARSGLDPDKDAQVGLSLWEMNALLEKSDTNTFYGKREYQEFLREEELLVDRDQGLRLTGLQRYYEKHGRLAEDILRWGVGGIDALLGASVNFELTFDPDALGSILQLLEKRPLFAPELLKWIATLCTWREVKVDKRLDKFSELLTELPWAQWGLKELHAKLLHVLRQPGGLIEVVEFLFAQFMEAETGILPVLRRYLSPSGFEYTSYDTTFTNPSYLEDLYEEMDRTVEAMLAAEDAARAAAEAEAARIEAEEVAAAAAQLVAARKAQAFAAGTIFVDEAALQAEAIEEVRSERSRSASPSRPGTSQSVSSNHHNPMDVSSPGSPPQGTNNAANIQPFSSTSANNTQANGISGGSVASGSSSQKVKLDKAALAAQEAAQVESMRRQYNLRQKLMTAKAIASLPARLTSVSSTAASEASTASSTEPQSATTTLDIDLAQVRAQIIADLVFLHEIRTIDGVTLSLEDSMRIDSKRQQLEQQLEDLQRLEIARERRFLEHSLALYDVLRTFCSGIASCGSGTRDMSVRLACEGLPLFDTLFAPGQGAKSYMQERQHAKRERFEQRKLLALAALERERLRRTMTAADHERLQRRKERQRKRAFEKDEKRAFDECLRGVTLAMEETAKGQKVAMAEWATLIKRFETLMKVQDERFPQALPAQITKNNVAAIYVEVYGLDHPLCERTYPVLLSCGLVLMCVSKFLRFF